MPVIIEDMSTTLELKDEEKILMLIRHEIMKALAGKGAAAKLGGVQVDPADPAAGGKPGR